MVASWNISEEKNPQKNPGITGLELTTFCKAEACF
jgi:hypothetical protein